MCSVCCFSHRGTFSLRVECSEEGQMGQRGSEWNRSWLRNAGGVFGGLEWSLGSKGGGGLTCRVGWVIRGWQLRADPSIMTNHPAGVRLSTPPLCSSHHFHARNAPSLLDQSAKGRLPGIRADASWLGITSVRLRSDIPHPVFVSCPLFALTTALSAPLLS